MHLSMIRIVFLLSLLCFLKIQHYPVNAKTQACWLRAVFEHMAEMRFTAAAFNFGPRHAMTMIGHINDRTFADGFIEAGPSATAFKFGVTFKQGVAANSTVIGSDLFKSFELAGKRPFGTLLPRNV